jgi:hypothetical protein
MNDNRLNFDEGDLNGINNDLLKDVMEATEQAKKRKDDDKAKDAQLAQKSQDRTLMYVIIGVAAVVLLVIAYFTVFAKDEPAVPAGGTGGSGGSLPFVKPQSGGQPSLNSQPRPVVTPNTPSQGYRPPVAPQAPKSEPIQRNGSDTYDEGSGNGGM